AAPEAPGRPRDTARLRGARLVPLAGARRTDSARSARGLREARRRFGGSALPVRSDRSCRRELRPQRAKDLTTLQTRPFEAGPVGGSDIIRAVFGGSDGFPTTGGGA